MTLRVWEGLSEVDGLADGSLRQRDRSGVRLGFEVSINKRIWNQHLDSFETSLAIFSLLNPYFNLTSLPDRVQIVRPAPR